MRMGKRDFFRGLEIHWSMKTDKTQDFMNLVKSHCSNGVNLIQFKY